MRIMTDKQQVKALLQEFCDAYEERNMSAILNLFATECPIMLLGTGQDERMNSIEAIKQQLKVEWTQAEQANFNLDEIQSEVMDNVAWMCAHATVQVWINGEQRIYPCMRSTHMLIKEKGAWRFCLSHWSMPANQAPGSFFPE